MTTEFNPDFCLLVAFIFCLLGMVMLIFVCFHEMFGVSNRCMLAILKIWASGCFSVSFYFGYQFYTYIANLKRIPYWMIP